MLDYVRVINFRIIIIIIIIIIIMRYSNVTYVTYILSVYLFTTEL